MVPRDLFNRMAILALVAILLAAALSLQAFAAEDDFQDSGFFPGDTTEDPSGDLSGGPSEPYPEDSSPDGSEIPPDEPSEDEPTTLPDDIPPGLVEDVSAIRQSLEILLYFVIPFSAALLFVYKFCMWFYYTFVRSVL